MVEKDNEYWRNEAVGFLALSTVRGVGYWTLHRLAASGIRFKDFLKNSSCSELEKELRVTIEKSGVDWAQYQKILWGQGLDLARDLGSSYIRLIFRDQEGFPVSLKDIPDGPLWLFVQGNTQNLYEKSVAIVGTRKPSHDGLFLTKYVVAALSSLKLPTVSGLASGIDQLAHEESLRYHIPTIAVLGNGILRDFPKGSEALRKLIVSCGGTVVTEYLPHQSYSAENFVRRNRIQAALCDTLIPVEWSIKSGTAHTVEYAYKYGRKIANVFLPHTTNHRPEIPFSEESRKAVSFEVPMATTELLRYINEGELVSTSSEPDQQSLDI
jgi:DNA protecting protein DprA